MPRAKRKYGNKCLNHCIIRGVNKCDIFFDDSDRRKFLKELNKSKEKYNVKIGAYALMQNHVHLVTKSDGDELSKFFQSLQISYSIYFNKKYERVGHLFENRFKNKIVDSDNYVRNLVKYIHFNPEKAGICKATEYKWSSYKEFIFGEKIIDKNMILLYYDNDAEKALKKFQKDHQKKLNDYYINYAEYEMVERLTDEQVKYMINEVESKIKKDDYSILDIKIRNKVLKEILNVKGVSINQISRVTGINRVTLNKIKDELNESKSVPNCKKIAIKKRPQL